MSVSGRGSLAAAGNASKPAQSTPDAPCPWTPADHTIRVHEDDGTDPLSVRYRHVDPLLNVGVDCPSDKVNGYQGCAPVRRRRFPPGVPPARCAWRQIHRVILRVTLAAVVAICREVGRKRCVPGRA